MLVSEPLARRLGLAAGGEVSVRTLAGERRFPVAGRLPRLRQRAGRPPHRPRHLRRGPSARAPPPTSPSTSPPAARRRGRCVADAPRPAFGDAALAHPLQPDAPGRGAGHLRGDLRGDAAPPGHGAPHRGGRHRPLAPGAGAGAGRRDRPLPGPRRDAGAGLPASSWGAASAWPCFGLGPRPRRRRRPGRRAGPRSSTRPSSAGRSGSTGRSARCGPGGRPSSARRGSPPCPAAAASAGPRHGALP